MSKSNRRNEGRYTKAHRQRHFQKQVNREGVQGYHVNYIDERWEAFAGIAWNQYIKKGRGALMLQPDAGFWRPSYVSLATVETNPELGQYENLVKGYRPETQVVIIFVISPNRLIGFVRGASPKRLAPKAACELLGPYS